MLTRDRTRGADSLSVITSVDRDGRLADRLPMRVMAWFPGAPISFSVDPGPVAIVQPGGDGRINSRGYLRLPLRIRRRCKVEVGSRVLVVPNKERAEVLVLPMWVLDDLLITFRSSTSTKRGPT
ncbi:hypothetical protein [Asanoa ishikariensis]|nr:hypothetical protein [Asanoa ishikariensis]